MTFLKTAALSAALLAAAGAGAALAPVGHGQDTSARAVAPRAFEMISGGGRIGVSVSDIDGEDAKTRGGVRVDSVEDDSPASKAGLRKGDVVVEFDGERVRSVRQFTRLVSETPAGRQVATSVMRDGQRVSVNVTPRESAVSRVFREGNFEALRDFGMAVPPVPARPARPMQPPPAPRATTPRAPLFESFGLGRNQLGVTITTLSDQLATYFGAKNGVLVTDVAEDSAAAKAGVKAGDVIVSLNGSSIETSGDISRQMQRLDAGEEFTLNILRDRKSMTLKGKAEAAPNRRWTTRTIL